MFIFTLFILFFGRLLSHVCTTCSLELDAELHVLDCLHMKSKVTCSKSTTHLPLLCIYIVRAHAYTGKRTCRLSYHPVTNSINAVIELGSMQGDDRRRKENMLQRLLYPNRWKVVCWLHPCLTAATTLCKPHWTHECVMLDVLLLGRDIL